MFSKVICGGKVLATVLTTDFLKMLCFNMLNDIGCLFVWEATDGTLPNSTIRILTWNHVGPHFILSQHKSWRKRLLTHIFWFECISTSKLTIFQMLCQISGSGETFATELTRHILKMDWFNVIHNIGGLLVREITDRTLPQSTIISLDGVHPRPYITFPHHETWVYW